MTTRIGLLSYLLFAILWSQTGSQTHAQETASTNPSSAKPSNDATQRILALEKEWVAAEIKHDSAALGRILDDKFVATFGAGKPFGKDTFIKEIASAEPDPTESQTLTDKTVIIDQDTAIVVGIDTLKGTRNGTPYTLTARYTVTYILRNGQWVALAEHLVKMPDPK